MEDRKTFFNYAAEAMITYAATILLLNILCLTVGDDAKGYSTMFSLGSAGIPAETLLQFIPVSIVTIAAKYLFFTDRLIKRMSVTLRTICMSVTIIAFMAVCIVVFEWFPKDLWEAWLAFFISFGLSFLFSVIIMSVKEKVENKRMEEAVRRLHGERSGVRSDKEGGN